MFGGGWPWGKKAVGEKRKNEAGKRRGKGREKGGKRRKIGKIDEQWGKNRFSHIFPRKPLNFHVFPQNDIIVGEKYGHLPKNIP